MPKDVLVIEDEDNLGKSIKTFLEQYGFQVTCINDGVAGLEEIQNKPPDLILTDLLLPRLHGFDIVRTVKLDKRLKDIPMMVMTAVYKDSIHKLEAKRLGVKSFIEKPLNFSELLKMVESILGVAEPAPPPPKFTLPPPPPVEEPDFDSAEVSPAPPPVSSEERNAQREEAIKQQFKELQREYASRLPQKILDLEKMWRDVLNSDETAVQLAKFRRMVHSIAGSGETFGFKDITDIARQLEVQLDMIIVEGAETVSDHQDQIDRLLDDMRHDPLISTELEMLRYMK